MIRLLIQNWWLLFLRGVLAIAFAIFIFVFLPFLPAPFLRQREIAANPANANCRRNGAGRNGKKTKMKIANAIARTPRRNSSHQFWISKRIISSLLAQS